MLDGEMVRISSSQSGPRGNGVVRELRGACGACRRRRAARSWELGCSWTWNALANASWATAGPPHWSLKPAGRPTAQHAGCQTPMMKSTSHEIGSSGKGAREQFEQKKPQAWHHPPQDTAAAVSSVLCLVR